MYYTMIRCIFLEDKHRYVPGKGVKRADALFYQQYRTLETMVCELLPSIGAAQRTSQNR